jgi:hypothetical protein
MFKTLKANPKGETTECLVYPLVPDTPGGNNLGIIYLPHVLYQTHVVLNPVSGKGEEARMEVEVIVKNGHNEKCTVDPFDFRWSSGMFCLWLARHLHCHRLNLT